MSIDYNRLTSPEIDTESYQLNVTKSLSNTKFVLSTGQSLKKVSWTRISDFLKKCYLNPCKLDSEGKELKDAAGVNFSQFKFLTKGDLNRLLEAKCIEFNDELYSKIDKNFKPTVSSYKYDHIKTFPQRQKIIENAFQWTTPENPNKGVIVRRKKFLTKTPYRVLFLDYDNSTPPYRLPCSVLDILDKYNFTYISYSTFSSSVLKPRFRVIIPYNDFYSKKYQTVSSELIFYLLNPDYKDYFEKRLDLTCLHDFRFFYVPNIPSGMEKTTDNLPHDDKHFFVSKQSGQFLDVVQCCKIKYFLQKYHGYQIKNFEILNKEMKKV